MLYLLDAECAKRGGLEENFLKSVSANAAKMRYVQKNIRCLKNVDQK